MDDDAPRLRGLGYVGYRKVRQAAVAALTDTGPVKLFGAGSAGR